MQRRIEKFCAPGYNTDSRPKILGCKIFQYLTKNEVVRKKKVPLQLLSKGEEILGSKVRYLQNLPLHI